MRGPVFRVCALCLLAILLGGAAHAAIISDSKTIGLTRTNWSQAINLEKYHGDIADLTGVVITLAATGQSEIAYENLAESPAPIQLNWTATVIMQKNGSTLLTAAPAYSTTVTPPAYDGYLGWDGTSGDTFTTSDNKSSSMTLSSGFGDYVGAGTFQLDILAGATSLTVGTGNLAAYYNTLVGATAKVEYMTETPEPGSVIALATGLIGLVGFSTRRRK